MPAPQNSQSQRPAQKKLGKHARVIREEKALQEAGIAPDKTYSQDADRHKNITHQKSAK